MKKIIIALLLIGGVIFQSCDDFLNIKPRNVKVVKTVKDYRDILASYMNWLKTPKTYNKSVLGEAHGYPKFDLMQQMLIYTGEVELRNGYLFDGSTGEMLPFAENSLGWLDKGMTYVWQQNYKFTGLINFIIDHIDEAALSYDSNMDKDANANMKNYVKGEALIWRAYVYYKTLQYYAPYKDNKLGIVINKDTYLDPIHSTIKRSTQTECYKQIISDCNEVLKLLKITPKNRWNFAYDKDFVNAMLANLYMYKAMSAASEDSDWSNAIKHADNAIGSRVLSSDPSIIKDLFNSSDRNNGYKVFNSDEYFIRIMKYQYFDFPTSLQGEYYYKINADSLIVKRYKDSDIRKGIYFKFLGEGYAHNKYSYVGSWDGKGGLFMPFRLADMFLIKAEALVRTNQNSKAQEVLMAFKEKRYTDAQTVPTDQNKLLEDILNERKLEFLHENDKNWLDMKRLEKRFVRKSILNRSFILESDDFRYSFPIPVSDLGPDSDVVQNPGWEAYITE